jgi:hypothetical protein
MFKVAGEKAKLAKVTVLPEEVDVAVVFEVVPLPDEHAVKTIAVSKTRMTGKKCKILCKVFFIFMLLLLS